MKQRTFFKSSQVTEARLLEIERTQKRRTDRPRQLDLKDIHVADKVFQWRNRKENIVPSAHHLKELVRVLKATKQPLDPIVVTPIGHKFFLIEGHHRLEAYYAAKWQKRVPVRYFEGGVKEAQDEALMLNIKDKLKLTKSEKFDAAFRLLKDGSKTYDQISKTTTVSVRTIATMAKVLRESPGAVEENSWRRAWWSYNKSPTDDHEDRKPSDWLEEKAQKLANQIAKNVGVDFVRDADVTARALEIIDEDLPDALICEWLDRAQDVLLDIAPGSTTTARGFSGILKVTF